MIGALKGITRKAALGMMCLATSLAAPAGWAETVRDEFDAISYGGNNGTVNWSNDWQESGESNGPTSGVVVVDSGFTPNQCSAGDCLQIGGFSFGSGSWGASRQVDLSGATAATLSYEWGLDTDQGYYAEGVNPVVQVRLNPASTWQTVHTLPEGQEGPLRQFKSVDIFIYASSQTQVRFITDSTTDIQGFIYFDNIQIDYAFDTSDPADCNFFVDQDSWLNEGSPTENNGTEGELSASDSIGGSERPVYRYDLSSIGPSATDHRSHRVVPH